MQRVELTNTEELEQIADWLTAHKASLTSDAFIEAFSVIQCLKFIASAQGEKTLRKRREESFYDDVIYSFIKQGCEYIPIHIYKDTGVAFLTRLMTDFIGSFKALTSDAERASFLSKLNGACIQNRVNAAFDYAQVIINANIKPFDDLMKQYVVETLEELDEANHIKVKAEYSLTQVCEIILRRHEHQPCLNVNGLCTEGMITRNNVKKYLEFAGHDDDFDFDDEFTFKIDRTKSSEAIGAAIMTVVEELSSILENINDAERLGLLVLLLNTQSSVLANNAMDDADIRVIDNADADDYQSINTLIPLIREGIKYLLTNSPIKYFIMNHDHDQLNNIANLIGSNGRLPQAHVAANFLRALIIVKNECKAKILLEKFVHKEVSIGMFTYEDCVFILKTLIDEHSRGQYSKKSVRITQQAKSVLKSIEAEHAKSSDTPKLDEETLKRDLLSTASMLSGDNWCSPTLEEVREYERAAGNARLFKLQPVRASMLDFSIALTKK